MKNAKDHVQQVHEDWEKQVDDVDAEDDDNDENVRGWKTGQCQSCGIMETGHHCNSCKKLCCNLCNQMEVDDITDIQCRDCLDAGEFMEKEKTEEIVNRTSEREGGGE